MSNLADVSDFIAKSGFGSESEGEDAGESRVTLAQDMGKGNLASKQSRVKLHEVGPRLDLEVIKVEEGLGEGKVLFHKYEHRTKAEINDMDMKQREKKKIKEQRRREQAENVKRKQELAKAKAAEKAAKGGKKQEGPKKKMWWDEELEDAKAARREREADDDAEYYRDEVGEEPDETFKRGSRGPKRTRPDEGSRGTAQKAKQKQIPSKTHKSKKLKRSE